MLIFKIVNKFFDELFLTKNKSFEIYAYVKKLNKLKFFLLPSDRKVLHFLKERKIQNPILLAGFPKSGNTWTRFVIYNYYNIYKNDAGKTLTFNELNAINYHVLDDGITSPFKSGFPPLYQTHMCYRNIFNFFKVIFIYRNPLDTLISNHYIHMNNVNPFFSYSTELRSKFLNIDYFVRFFVEEWAHHYKLTKAHSDIVLCYERLKKDPFREFSKLFKVLNIELNESILRKSIKISSFDNIKKMGRQTNQLYGVHNPNRFKGEFTRSGKTHQYLEELKPSTIEYTKAILDKYKIQEVFN